MVARIRRNNAFLLLILGGVGQRAYRYLCKIAGDNDELPAGSRIFDTDAIGASNDSGLRLGLTPQILDVIRGNPNRFGHPVGQILRELDHMLGSDQVLNGSRTCRGLTQLAFTFHRRGILRSLRNAVIEINQKYHPRSIVPILFGSSGGGAGSALQILLPLVLKKTETKQIILRGLPDSILERPISVVAEPFSFSDVVPDDHADIILGNSLAFRDESELLLKRDALQSVIHIAYSNNSGTVLAEPDLMARVLGTSVFHLQQNWEYFKARWVDSQGLAATRRMLCENAPEQIYESIRRILINRGLYNA